MPKINTDFFGEKEKSKTTNMADLFHEVKKQKEVGFDNTYDFSKLKKGTFTTKSKSLFILPFIDILDEANLYGNEDVEED